MNRVFRLFDGCWLGWRSPALRRGSEVSDAKRQAGLWLQRHPTFYWRPPGQGESEDFSQVVRELLAELEALEKAAADRLPD